MSMQLEVKLEELLWCMGLRVVLVWSLKGMADFVFLSVLARLIAWSSLDLLAVLDLVSPLGCLLRVAPPTRIGPPEFLYSAE